MMCALVMGIVSYGCYEGMMMSIGNTKLSMMVTIMVAIIVYFVTAILSKTITQGDLNQVPGGKKLSKFVRV